MELETKENKRSESRKETRTGGSRTVERKLWRVGVIMQTGMGK